MPIFILVSGYDANKKPTDFRFVLKQNIEPTEQYLFIFCCHNNFRFWSRVRQYKNTLLYLIKKETNKRKYMGGGRF